MLRPLATVAVLVLVASCGGNQVTDDAAGSDAFTTCESGIVVYNGVDCAVVSFDSNQLPEAVQEQINELKAEADADPSRAMANVQKIQRLLAAQPFQVCDAMQNDPDGVFLTTDNIAPVADALDAEVCPGADRLSATSG